MTALQKLLATVLVLTFSLPTQAGMPIVEEMTCPVGGEKFTHIGTASYSRWGSRPDGKPYGSWEFPIPLPECPRNHLVLYKKFDATEIKMLKSLVKMTEYVRLAGDSSYYRAAWLMKAMNDGKPADRLWMIAQASWQVDAEPARKARYQREFAEGVAALPVAPDDLDWIVMNGRAANAWRELGEFEHANAVLKAVPLSNLDVSIPAEKVEGTTPSGLGKIVTNMDEIQAAKARRGWINYFETLAKVIARRDRSSEPLDMVPAQVVIGKCMEWDDEQSGKQDPVCTSEEVRTRVAQQRELRAKMRLPPPIPSNAN